MRSAVVGLIAFSSCAAALVPVARSAACAVSRPTRAGVAVAEQRYTEPIFDESLPGTPTIMDAL